MVRKVLFATKPINNNSTLAAKQDPTYHITGHHTTPRKLGASTFSSTRIPRYFPAKSEGSLGFRYRSKLSMFRAFSLKSSTWRQVLGQTPIGNTYDFCCANPRTFTLIHAPPLKDFPSNGDFQRQRRVMKDGLPTSHAPTSTFLTRKAGCAN